MLLRFLCAMVILASLLGCGTIGNMDHERTPYGGVAADVNHAINGQGLVEDIITVPLAVMDIPFSMVGDTITLPVTSFSSYAKWRETRPRKTYVPKNPPQGQFEP